MEQKEDRLSNLPKIILHHILSRLPEKDAARTSVLSKAWADTWFTFPILSFSDYTFTGMIPRSMGGFQRKRKNFIDYVTRTLLRFYDQGLAIKECKIILNRFELHCMSNNVDLWLKTASESGVEVLQLYLFCGPEGHGECYDLPKGVIEAKSLTKLVLKGEIRVDQAFMNQSNKFFSLKVLSLWLVLLGDEHAIEHLISCCPLIEHITLKRCSALSLGGSTKLMKCLSIHGLPKLKTVDVEGIQEVYIDVPSLENLYYCAYVLDTPLKIYFDRCKNLKRLYLISLKGITITDKWFLELFSKFPFLESLKFVKCTMSETINISSVQLKGLDLSSCLNFKEVNIDAPNLLSCVYCSDDRLKPIISFVRSSSKLEVDVQIYIDYLDLGNLKEILQNIKPENVLTSLSLSLVIFELTEDVLNPTVFQFSSPPPSIKHLHLRSFPNNETLFSSLLNVLLSSCCPATISLSLHPCSKAFIEFLYKTLMRRKDDDCFCTSSDTKCWWHGLKDVKVTSSMKTDENVDFKTLLESPPYFTKDLSFRLEF